jgi:hypothetical protein
VPKLGIMGNTVTTAYPYIRTIVIMMGRIGFNAMAALLGSIYIVRRGKVITRICIRCLAVMIA